MITFLTESISWLEIYRTYKANRGKYNDILIKKRGEGDEAGKCYKS